MRIAATSCRIDTFHIASTEFGNRNDMICADAFGCEYHYGVSDRGALRDFDAVFMTMPKVQGAHEERWMEILHLAKEWGKKVILFQEAETFWPMTRSWDEQKSFIELMGKVDLFLTHQERDIALWGPFRNGNSTIRWRTCLDVNAIKKHRIDPAEKEKRPILCGSSFDSRANGLTGLVACKGLGVPLLVQNRTSGEEYEKRLQEGKQVFGIEYESIPHQGWFSWLKAISQAYIAVHMMPAAAAGRDQVALAALGIPTIGNDELDMQRDLFPGLGSNCFDVNEVRAQVKILLQEPTSYESIRATAILKVETECSLEAAKKQAAGIMEWMGWNVSV